MKTIISSLIILIITTIGFSQEQYSKAIEDNSFLIEEAYNQEAGVIQHISNGIYFSSPQTDFLYAFTEEWPMLGLEHQFSVTLPYESFQSGSATGIGDVLINYRYQLSTNDDGIAISPRLSLIVPTGNSTQGLGMGVWGIQANFPVSKRLSEQFVSHFNAGFTLLPGVEYSALSNNVTTKTLTSYNLGASLIWLTNSQFNVMLEAVDNINNDFDTNGEVVSSNEFIVSPGIRYAIDINALQIVPGLAVPFRISENNSDIGMFFYLSFEHSL